MICPDVLKKNADDDAVIFPCLLNINSIYVGSQCFYHYCVRKNSVLWKEERADYNSLVEMAKYFIVSYQESKNKEKMAKNFLLRRRNQTGIPLIKFIIPHSVSVTLRSFQWKRKKMFYIWNIYPS